MKKRGNIVYKALIIMIVSGMVLISFILAGKSFGSQEAFYKGAVAKDLALTLDVMYALPGDVKYTYPNDVSEYDVEINDKIIKVFDHESGNLDPTRALYTFAGIDEDSIESEIKGQKFAKLEKSGNMITVTGVDE